MEPISEIREFDFSQGIVDSLNIIADRESTTKWQRAGAYVHIAGAIMGRISHSSGLRLALSYARNGVSFDQEIGGYPVNQQIELEYIRTCARLFMTEVLIFGVSAFDLFYKNIDYLGPNLLPPSVGYMSAFAVIVSGLRVIDLGVSYLSDPVLSKHYLS